MVRAILRDESPKAQTRRIVRERDIYQREDGEWIIRFHGAQVGLVAGSKDCDEIASFDSPYGARGDRLWVRESLYHGEDNFYFTADRQGVGNERHALLLDRFGPKKGIPSIHMPRAASRITLAVESVRVERLQDIKEEDARGEGVAPLAGAYRIGGKSYSGEPYRHGFFRAWVDIHNQDSLDANPWVWVVGFSRVKS